jgi:hypothetical protein
MQTLPEHDIGHHLLLLLLSHYQLVSVAFVDSSFDWLKVAKEPSYKPVQSQYFEVRKLYCSYHSKPDSRKGLPVNGPIMGRVKKLSDEGLT